MALPDVQEVEEKPRWHPLSPDLTTSEERGRPRKRRRISSARSILEKKNQSIDLENTENTGLDSQEIIPKVSNPHCAVCTLPCWFCQSAETRRRPTSNVENKVNGTGLGLVHEREDGSEDMSVTRDSSISRSSSKTGGSKRKRTDGLGFIGPKDDHFEEYILGPCGITISKRKTSLQPTDIPDDGISDDPSLKSNVHLNIDDETAAMISQQFSECHERQYNEATFSKLVSKWLEPFDNYVYNSDPECVTSLWREKWKPGKDGPYISAAQGFTYDWDIEPDATYMIASNMFNPTLRIRLRYPDLDWAIAEPNGVSPYLTFEMKAAEKTGKDSKAKYQVAAASAVWLHQRRRLKRELGSIDFSDIRHYSIVINSLAYRILEATVSGTGYKVETIYHGTLSGTDGVTQYAKWHNAIHRWGLGTNARAFKKDILALWEQKKAEAEAALDMPPPSLRTPAEGAT